jgi:hypothetical protein
MSPVPTACALLLASLSMSMAQAPRWQVQYAYDEAKTELSFLDIQNPSPKRGFAAGTLVDDRGSRRPTAVVTADGGAHWESVKIGEIPFSLFFLNDSIGWMVTEKGLWKTQEGGRDWKKLPKPPTQIIRVFFLDEQTGFAACFKKTVLVTHDGGEKWEVVKASQEPAGSTERSLYNWIGFANAKVGSIFGYNDPASRWGPDLPIYLDPEAHLAIRETPKLTYSLTTHDGGQTWHPASMSLLGGVTRTRFSASGIGLGLIEHGDSATYPSEVYKLDWVSGKSHTVFRDKRYHITDIWLTPNGVAYMAGVVPPGKARSVAPGTIVAFKSKDLVSWDELEVDYRAVGLRALLSGNGDDDLWMATDNGMILKLK